MKKLKTGGLSCFKKCGSKKFEELSNLEYIVLGSLVFRCQNDECTDRISYFNYFDHLMNKCKVVRYRKVDVPQGENEKNQIEKVPSPWNHEKNPYHNCFFIGDLNRIYLEEDEELEEDMKQANEEAHKKFLKDHDAFFNEKVEHHNDYDDYGNDYDDDDDNEGGEEDE